MADEKREQLLPPYLPYRTFRNYLDGLRAGIPARIDRSVLRNFSGIAQTLLLNALRYLDLIEKDGTPRDRLEKLVRAEGAEHQKILRDILKSSYGFLFSGNGINLQGATPAQLNSAFVEAGLSGDTVRKAVAFFLRAAKDAQLPLSPFLKVPRTVRLGGIRRRSRVVTGIPQQYGNDLNQQNQTGGTAVPTPYQMLYDILDPENMDEQEQQAVWTLIRYLKKRGSGE